jgi:hypothetical protein
MTLSVDYYLAEPSRFSVKADDAEFNLSYALSDSLSCFFGELSPPSTILLMF